VGPKEEPGIPALLLALAATLYVVAWALAGPPGDREVPAHASAARAVEVSLPSR